MTRPPWLGLLLITFLAAYTSVNRLDYPYGEKYLATYVSGSEDLKAPFLGAKAMLAGEDPYRTRRPELALPNGWVQAYPVSLLVLYVPLVWATNGDFERAAHVFFKLDLLCVIALGVIVARLLRSVWPDRGQSAFVFVVPAAVTLGLCTSGQFAIDRAQSELLGAALSWGAVVAYLARRAGLTLFLGVLAAGLKGYAALLVLGLGLQLLLDGRWKGVLAGSAAALALNTLPVAGFFVEGWHAVFQRVQELAFRSWPNHSFGNVAYTIAPDFEPVGRLLMIGLGLATSAGAWLGLRRARGREDEVFWLVLFATSALATLTGAGKTSSTYTLELVLPGALVLIGCRAQLARTLRLRVAWRALEVGLVAAVACMVVYRLRRAPSIPLGGFGMVALVWLSAAVVLLGLARGRSPQPPVIIA